MNPQDAIMNLQNLIKAALKAGMFSEVEAVYAMQASLDTLKKIAEGYATERGAMKKNEIPEQKKLAEQE